MPWPISTFKNARPRNAFHECVNTNKGKPVPATVNNSKKGKIGLALSLVAAALIITGLLVRSVGAMIGVFILPVSLIAFVLSCGGLSKDQLKLFAVAGFLISSASLTWLLRLVIISVFDH
jgi:hypothetical protein